MASTVEKSLRDSCVDVTIQGPCQPPFSLSGLHRLGTWNIIETSLSIFIVSPPRRLTLLSYPAGC